MNSTNKSLKLPVAILITLSITLVAISLVTKNNSTVIVQKGNTGFDIEALPPGYVEIYSCDSYWRDNEEKGYVFQNANRRPQQDGELIKRIRIATNHEYLIALASSSFTENGDLKYPVRPAWLPRSAAIFVVEQTGPTQDIKILSDVKFIQLNR